MTKNLIYGFTQEVHELAEKYIKRDILINQTMLVFDMLRNSDVKFIIDAGYTFDNIENYYTSEDDHQEICEWYLITSWLFDKLKDLGEPVLATDYGIYWGRTATGQAIILDGTIQKISKNYI